MCSRRQILIAAGLFLLAVWIYYPGVLTLPVADDFRIIGRTDFSDAARAFHDTVGYGRNEYRPLVAVSFAASNSLWSGDPRAYHLESIFLHAVVVVLVFAWLHQITGSTLIAGIAAVLFALHPIHHARVVWIAARDSLPSTLFLLLALIFYTRARQGTVSARRPWRLISISLIFFILSLLFYEGAVILPAVVAEMEFFLFSDPEERGLPARLRAAATRTIPFVFVAGGYLVWWLLLFRGEVGEYNLQFGIAGFGQNCYRLLYQLFHGNSGFAGVLYFLLILMSLLLPRGRRALLWFSLLFIMVAYVPFVAISGFASRFGYVSAIGYVLLAATILANAMLSEKSNAIHVLQPWLPALAVLIFATLACYYATTLRGRISDWKTAGEIAARIPNEVKARYPDLPEGSTLVLARIPLMHGHAYVYPLGLKAALERTYPGRNLQIHYGPGEVDEIIKRKDLSAPKPIYFQYIPDKQTVNEITAPSGGQ